MCVLTVNEVEKVLKNASNMLNADTACSRIAGYFSMQCDTNHSRNCIKQKQK